MPGMLEGEGGRANPGAHRVRPGVLEGGGAPIPGRIE